MIVNIHLFLRFPQCGIIDLLHDFLIGGVDLRCVLLVDIMTYNRVQSQPQDQQKRNDRQSDCDTLLVYICNRNLLENCVLFSSTLQNFLLRFVHNNAIIVT